jgi:hypothetical protein
MRYFLLEPAYNLLAKVPGQFFADESPWIGSKQQRCKYSCPKIISFVRDVNTAQTSNTIIFRWTEDMNLKEAQICRSTSH